jgi:hypothetical protein
LCADGDSPTKRKNGLGGRAAGESGQSALEIAMRSHVRERCAEMMQLSLTWWPIPQRRVKEGYSRVWGDPGRRGG